jgi:P-type E1-E2 ATPase
MLEYEVPGWKRLRLSALALDLNGTTAMDGEVVPGVGDRLATLKGRGLAGYLLTADTRGRGAETADALGLVLHRLDLGQEGAQKRALVEALGAEQVVAVGNGANDVEMLQAAALGIGVMQEEGLATGILGAADVVVPDICAALDLLIKPRRLIATLRR